MFEKICNENNYMRRITIRSPSCGDATRFGRGIGPWGVDFVDLDENTSATSVFALVTSSRSTRSTPPTGRWMELGSCCRPEGCRRRFLSRAIYFEWFGWVQCGCPENMEDTSVGMMWRVCHLLVCYVSIVIVVVW